MPANVQLRERVTFLLPATPVSDGQGGTVSGGSDTEVEEWAAVKPLSGRALLALGQVVTGQGYEVTIRANGAVEPAAGIRLRWLEITMAARFVVRGERRDLWVLTCFDNGRN